MYTYTLNIRGDKQKKLEADKIFFFDYCHRRISLQKQNQKQIIDTFSSHDEACHRSFFFFFRAAG